MKNLSTVRVGETESVESAIKRFKRKCQKDGIIGDLRKHEQYKNQVLRRKRNKKPLLKEAKKERKLNSMHQFIWCFFVAIKLNLKAIFHIY